MTWTRPTRISKVAATIISKDPGNWYDTFMINKGSKDGIRVDNNVIAGKGLVGIVTEVRFFLGNSALHHR
ncbi:MAG: rod shape-determining protein MreC [Gallintestinimicrobium sp.]